MLAILMIMTVAVAPAVAQLFPCSNAPNYMEYGHKNIRNPTDCRRFYQCDNAHQGFPVNCPAGTLFNMTTGTCTLNSECPVWKNRCTFSGTTQQTFRYQGVCCRNYFIYTCPTNSAGIGSWVWNMCPTGQGFNENTGQCDNSINVGACLDCGVASQVDDCNASRIEVVSDCTFRKAGFPDIMRCSPGTKIDRTTCRCDVMDTLNTCDPFINQGCMVYAMSSADGSLDALPSEATTLGSALDGRTYKINFFNGNGLTKSKDHAFTVAFTFNPSQVTGSSMQVLGQQCGTTSELALSMSVTRDSNSQFRVTITVTIGSQAYTITSNALNNVGLNPSVSTRIEVVFTIGKTATSTSPALSATIVLNGGGVVMNFPETRDLDTFGYWRQLRSCSLDVGNMGADNQFNAASGVVKKFIYRKC